MRVSLKNSFVAERRERLERHSHARNVIALNATQGDPMERTTHFVDPLLRDEAGGSASTAELKEYHKRQRDSWDL